MVRSNGEGSLASSPAGSDMSSTESEDGARHAPRKLPFGLNGFFLRPSCGMSKLRKGGRPRLPSTYEPGRILACQIAQNRGRRNIFYVRSGVTGNVWKKARHWLHFWPTSRRMQLPRWSRAIRLLRRPTCFVAVRPALNGCTPWSLADCPLNAVCCVFVHVVSDFPKAGLPGFQGRCQDRGGGSVIHVGEHLEGSSLGSISTSILTGMICAALVLALFHLTPLHTRPGAAPWRRARYPCALDRQCHTFNFSG